MLMLMFFKLYQLFQSVTIISRCNSTTKDLEFHETFETFIFSKYYNIDELHKLKIPNKEKSLSVFHINSCSNLLQSTNINFNVIAITETRIPKNVSITQNIALNNYSFERTPTESSAGGKLIYIANCLSYKIRSDLKIYKKIELESALIEKINSRKSYIIVGVI